MAENASLALFSGLLGFALSQFFNLVDYILRPRFLVVHFGKGIVSSYTGDPPETPWEIDLGFYLENHGRRSAKNTRVFVSILKTLAADGVDFELSSFNFCELKRPLDVIPPDEAVLIRLGRITSETHSLRIPLEQPTEDEDDFVDADTREKIAFSAKFHIACDDKSSMKVLHLEFRPDQDELAAQLIDDYESSSVPTKPADWEAP